MLDQKSIYILDGVILTISLAALCYSIAMLATDGKVCLDCFAIPIEIPWAIFGSSLTIMIICFISIYAAKKVNVKLLIALVVLLIVFWIASVMVTVVVTLWASTAGYIGEIQALAVGFEFSIHMLFQAFSLSHPNDWQVIQNTWGCCGIDIRATYIAENFTNTLHTGLFCNSTIDNQIHQIHTNFIDWTLEEIDGFFLTYFCDGALKASAQASAAVIGVVLSLLCVLLLLALFLKIQLIRHARNGTNNGGGGEKLERKSRMKTIIKTTSDKLKNRLSSSVLGMLVTSTIDENEVENFYKTGSSPVVTHTPPFKPRTRPIPPALPLGIASQVASPPPGLSPVAIPKTFGSEYDKYTRMKKAGLPEGAIRNAMGRDQVAIPDGFFEDIGENTSDHSLSNKIRTRLSTNLKFPSWRGGSSGASIPPPPDSTPPPSPFRTMAHRLSTGVRGMWSPPPPPPGFGRLSELSADSMSQSFAADNPSFSHKN